MLARWLLYKAYPLQFSCSSRERMLCHAKSIKQIANSLTRIPRKKV